jgi:predicted deacetylase
MTDPLPALVSVHDVMPETLEDVQSILALLTSRGVRPVTLLVVPGRDWTAAGIATLRDLQYQGCVLAGHGWTHRVKHVRGPKHRLHSRLMSRRAAEHLALDADAIAALITRCHTWFANHDLGNPELYVPPAWAMGTLNRAELAKLPFRQYEVFGGVYQAGHDKLTHLPLTGYEADTGWRALAVRAWNRANLRRARQDRPVRIGIHPFDLRLKLAADLKALLARPLECHDYRDIG